MAITVTDAFKAAWLNRTWKGWRRTVRIKRNYWTGAAYAREASWQTLRQDAVKRVEAFPQTLDSEFEAIFQISEFAVVVASPNGEFLKSTAIPSFWAADAVAESGYEPPRSELEIDFTLVLQDDTEETATLFSGIITDDPEQTSDGLHAVLQVASNARLIADSDAEQVSDPVTLEDCIPPTGDGTNPDFTSTSSGVARVSDLQVDASSLVQGRDNDWTVDNVGEDVPAAFTVRTTPAPGVGKTVKWSGRKWKQNISVDDFVTAVLDNAAFPAGKRELTPVIFPGGLSGFKRETDQADWEAGSLTNIDTTSVPGSILKDYTFDDFSDGDHSADPTWTVDAGSPSAASNRLVLTLNEYIHVTLGAQPFALQFTHQFAIGGGSGNDSAVIEFGLVTPGNFGVANSGYRLLLDRASGTAYLQRHDGVFTFVTLASASYGGGDTLYTFKVVRDGSGAMSIYVDGTLIMSATDNTYAAGTYLQLGHIGSIGTSSFDDFKVDDGAAAVRVSPEFDLLNPPTAWGTLDYTETLNGGTVLYETAVASASGGPYDAWVAIDPTSKVIQSALKQYLKVRITITPVANTLQSPEVADWRANFSTDSIFITVANLEGLDAESGGGWAAIERYVGPTGYAIGMRGNGNFFLRPRDVLGAPVATLTQDNCLKKLLSFDPGSKRVRNVGRVRYAGYLNEYDGAAAGEAAPTSEQLFGRKAKEVNYDRVLYANDVNIGEAQAVQIYTENYRRRRRWSFQCYLVPWLELLDRVTITFLRDPMAADPYAGDALWDNQPGYRLPVAGTPLNPLFVKDQLCRVLAWTPDVDRLDECVLSVEEIFDD